MCGGKKVSEECDFDLPVISIPANASAGSDSSQAEDTTSFAFPVLRDEEAQLAGRTRLALDFPQACILRGAGRDLSAELVPVTAAASGWTGSRQLVFRLRSSSYLAPIRTSPVLLQGRVFRVALWTNETNGFPCAPRQASASLILNYPVCRKKSQRRFKRDRYYRSGPGSLRGDPAQRRRLRGIVGRSDKCRVVPLTVDFQSIGWDAWVLAPPGYRADQCSGQCTTSALRRLNSTNHATVLSLLRDVRPDDVSDACCVPVRYQSQSLLYVNRHSHVVLKTFTHMRVSECACR